MIRNKTVGVLLAGGQSRRFGSPKAFAKLNGVPFYEWVYQCLHKVTDHVVIVTQPEFVSSFPETYDCIVDHPSVKGSGPLAGIFSAMDTIKGARYIVLPCDMPLMNPVFLQMLMEHCRGEQFLGVRLGEKEHPLVSIWRYDAKSVIYKQLTKGIYRVRETINQLNGRYIDALTIDRCANYYLMNVNSKDVLERVDFHATTDC